MLPGLGAQMNWNARNPEKVKVYVEKYNRKPEVKERVSNKSKEHYQAHKEEVKSKNREYRENHLEEIRIKNKQYYENNKERITAAQREKYRAMKELEIKSKENTSLKSDWKKFNINGDKNDIKEIWGYWF